MWWWGNICFNPHTVPMLFVKDCGTVSTQKKLKKYFLVLKIIISGNNTMTF